MQVKMPVLGLLILGAILVVNVSGFSILINQSRQITTGQRRLIGLLLTRPMQSTVNDPLKGDD